MTFWKPKLWPTWVQVNALVVAVVAFLTLMAQGQAAIDAFEWAMVANHHYVREMVDNAAAREATQALQREAMAENRFSRLQALLLQQNVTIIENNLKVLRPNLVQLEALLEQNPDNVVLRSQVAATRAEIEATERSLEHAQCDFEGRFFC